MKCQFLIYLSAPLSGVLPIVIFTIYLNKKIKIYYLTKHFFSSLSINLYEKSNMDNYKSSVAFYFKQMNYNYWALIEK